MSIHALPPHPVVLPVVAVDLGVLIRSRRNARRPRMTQAQLGAMIGYSAAWVCRVEKNELTPPWEILIRIARILTITPEELGLAPSSPGQLGPQEAARSAHLALPATRVAPDQAQADQEDDPVRRRNFLAGAAGLAPPWPPPPPRRPPRTAAPPQTPPQHWKPRCSSHPPPSRCPWTGCPSRSPRPAATSAKPATRVWARNSPL